MNDPIFLPTVSGPAEPDVINFKALRRERGMSTTRHRLHLTRQVFETEGRVSKSDADMLPTDVRDAVLNAMRVATFYENYPTEMIMPRDVTQILRQMDSQVVFTFELELTGGKEIVAACIVWDKEWPVIDGPDAIRISKFLETGTQQCILNGFNLQWTLNSLTLLRSLLHDATGCYFAATYGDNDPSIGNFLGPMKFLEWDAVPGTLRQWRMHHLEEHNETHRGVRWFRPNIATVVAAAERVVEMSTTRVQKRKESKETRKYPDVLEVEFCYDESMLDPILESARKISRTRPATVQELLKIIELPSIDPDFLIGL